MKCPSPIIIRVMSLALHILGTPKERTEVHHLGAEHKFLATKWVPPPWPPNERARSGGDDYIFWSCVQFAWRREQLDQLWREDDAPTSVGRMRALNIASVPPEVLEDLYQRREQPYLLPAEALKQGSPLAAKLAEWMQALVAEWSLVREAHPEAPTLLTLKHELAAAQRRAQKRSAAQARAAEEERLEPEHARGPAEDVHESGGALVEAQEQFATRVRVS